MIKESEKQGYTDSEIKDRISSLPRLASLRSISSALSELLNTEYSFTAQIAEIIRRDPSLTSRLLKLVNSVFYGITRKITNIEEAVFYLGLRQIRELAMATPVIEDFEKIQTADVDVSWKDLWRYSLGSALLSRELLNQTGISFDDDTDYLIGLLQKVGKIVMATTFPKEFSVIYSKEYSSINTLLHAEEILIGWNHAHIGAHYLKCNNINESIINAVKHQFEPSKAGAQKQLSSALFIVNNLLMNSTINSIDKIKPEAEFNVKTVKKLNICWNDLLVDSNQGRTLTEAALMHSLKRLSLTIQGML